jgi:hypothetical protein
LHMAQTVFVHFGRTVLPLFLSSFTRMTGVDCSGATFPVTAD